MKNLIAERINLNGTNSFYVSQILIDLLHFLQIISKIHSLIFVFFVAIYKFFRKVVFFVFQNDLSCTYDLT